MVGDENLKVRIRNAEGKYLSGEARNLEFTDDPVKALAFDYYRQEVVERLEILKRTSGIVLQAEAIDPGEIYEACDECNRLVMPFDLVFDGVKFRCQDCACQLPAANMASTR